MSAATAKTALFYSKINEFFQPCKSFSNFPSLLNLPPLVFTSSPPHFWFTDECKTYFSQNVTGIRASISDPSFVDRTHTHCVSLTYHTFNADKEVVMLMATNRLTTCFVNPIPFNLQWPYTVSDSYAHCLSRKQSRSISFHDCKVLKTMHTQWQLVNKSWWCTIYCITAIQQMLVFIHNSIPQIPLLKDQKFKKWCCLTDVSQCSVDWIVFVDVMQ